MRQLTGTTTLLRFVVRRDRLRMFVWVAAIAGLALLTVAGIKGLYPTQADLNEAAAAAKGNAAAIAFNGPVQGLQTVGGEVAFQFGAMGLVTVALMSLLMVGRLTRGEEEAGRIEMLRSLPVGSHAPTAAALLAVGAMDVIVGATVGLCLLGENLPVAGSIAFGVSFALVGLLFAAIALAAAEITENTRVVYGSVGAILGAAFVLRAVGDIGDGTVSWLSPIGWAQKTRPFAGERWWPFLPLLGAFAASIAVAAAISARRDVGSGLVPPRPGRVRAARSLGRPVGLAVRLQRGSLVGWSLGVVVTGVAYGSIAPSIDTFIGHNKALADMLAGPGGGSLTDAYFATSFQILALLGTGFAIQSALRLRSEETSLRAEPVLATPVSRWRWALSHLTVAFAGTVILMVASGAAVGLSYAVAGGQLSALPRLLGAALAYAPAMWLMVAAAFALVGLAPRGTIAVWAALVACLVIGLLGEMLRLSSWVKDLSPFEHIPRLPGTAMHPLPFVLLIALSAALTSAGLFGLRHRDIG